MECTQQIFFLISSSFANTKFFTQKNSVVYSDISLFKLLNELLRNKSCDSTFCLDDLEKEQDPGKDRKGKQTLRIYHPRKSVIVMMAPGIQFPQKETQLCLEHVHHISPLRLCQRAESKLHIIEFNRTCIIVQ